MEFRILGPLEAEEDGRQIPLGGEKQRALLALLLLSRGRPVSTDRLIEEIWSGEPPATALKSVQVYVARLRRALGDGRLVTRGRGYEIEVAPGELDADRFDELVRAASGAPAEEAAQRLREALALVRGAPLADLSLEPWAQADIARLEERRLAALEARTDADLELGRHRELVAELETLVGEHPFREHLLEQLMLALYRSGRQSDALDAYRRGAGRLRSEFGLEPGRSLQELERQILRQDPALDPPMLPVPRDGRRRSWRLVVSGALIIVSAAVAAAVVVLTHGSDASLAAVAPGVAIVDASSGRLVAHIGASEIKVPAEVITGDGSFWVWNLQPYEMVQVDPGDGQVVRRIGSPLGDTGGSGLVDGRSLWLGGPRLVRMDIPQARRVDTFRLSKLAGLTQGSGSFWVTRPDAGELLRVDRASGNVLHRWTGRPDATAVAYGDGAVWVGSARGVERVDPKTNKVTATATVPEPELAYLAVGGGYLWASNETKGRVYKFDDHSGAPVGTYETGEGAHQESYANGTLWVVNQDVGTVTGIDAATGERRIFQFGHPLQSVAALHGKLLVEINPGRTYEDRINALEGKIARLIIPIYQLANDNHPDPAVTPSNPFIFQAERATCAPLLGYPDAPPPRGQHLVPEAAAAVPALSSDRRTYTFIVRKGFRFAPPSNAQLDAQTFRYSIERALSSKLKLGSDAPGIRFLGDVAGAQAFHAGRAAHVSGIRVRGDRISVTLIRPSPDFLERLALPYFCPVPRDTPILPGGVQDRPPAGAGPYAFSGFIFNGEYAILKRNPNYGGSRPQLLDAIGFREGIGTEKAVARVKGGRWDAVEQFDPLLAPGGIVARSFAKVNPGGVSYRSFPRAMTFYLAFDANQQPFSDRRLRRAVALALDRRTLSSFWNQASPAVAQTGPSALQSAPTGMEPTARILPPGVRGGGQARSRPPDIERARKLAGSRHSTVWMAVEAGDAGANRFANIVRAALAPLGIDVRAVAVRNLSTVPSARQNRIQLAALETELDYPDPASFLTKMLGHDVPSAWLAPATRAAINRLSRLTGAARDRAAVQLATRLARRDVPVVPYGTPTIGAVLGSGLGCRVWNGVDAGLDLAALCLDRR